MSEIECPYCEHEQAVNHDDGFGFAEDELHQMQCRECEKMFTFWTTISFDYSPQKADCLNDSPHDFQWTKTYPPEYAQSVCTVCGEREHNKRRGEIQEVN